MNFPTFLFLFILFYWLFFQTPKSGGAKAPSAHPSRGPWLIENEYKQYVQL